jgi:hypothetical protein
MKWIRNIWPFEEKKNSKILTNLSADMARHVCDVGTLFMIDVPPFVCISVFLVYPSIDSSSVVDP